MTNSSQRHPRPSSSPLLVLQPPCPPLLEVARTPSNRPYTNHVAIGRPGKHALRGTRMCRSRAGEWARSEVNEQRQRWRPCFETSITTILKFNKHSLTTTIVPFPGSVGGCLASAGLRPVLGDNSLSLSLSLYLSPLLTALPSSFSLNPVCLSSALV